MAEIALKVHSGANYTDGDILAAFNNRQIRCVHAQHICHVKHAGGGAGVHRDSSHVARDFFEQTHEFRFERISKTEVKRIRLSDLTEHIFDGTSRVIDGKRQQIDVGPFVKRRLKHNVHAIFGTDGSEVWYGGRQDFSNAALDLVWNAIETKTPNRAADFTTWPCGSKDRRSHFFIAVIDFHDGRAADLVAPELDLSDPENPVTLRKRKHFIYFRSDLGLSAKTLSRIDDKRVEVLPRRDIKLDDTLIVKVW